MARSVPPIPATAPEGGVEDPLPGEIDPEPSGSDVAASHGREEATEGALADLNDEKHAGSRHTHREDEVCVLAQGEEVDRPEPGLLEGEPSLPICYGIIREDGVVEEERRRQRHEGGSETLQTQGDDGERRCNNGGQRGTHERTPDHGRSEVVGELGAGGSATPAKVAWQRENGLSCRLSTLLRGRWWRRPALDKALSTWPASR